MSGLLLTGVHKRFGDHVVLDGCNLNVPAGSFTALLGPSGAGKTTLLRLLAGFDSPDLGTISVGERTLSGPGVHVAPEKRRIGFVPQEGSLFPHLTVAGNVGFGLPRAERRGQVRELLEMVGLAELERRYPHQLSGGQQQRVALARALAVKPEVVLLDEPFASLDVHLRAGVRDDVKRILAEAGTTTLLVTHSQDEALSAADLVAVMRDGQIVQHANPRELYTVPRDERLARFVGEANLLPGELADGHVETVLGRLSAKSVGEQASGPVTVLIRPEQLTLGVAGNGGVGGRIVRRDYHGHDTVVCVELDAAFGGAILSARTLGSAQPELGDSVTVSAEGPVLVWSQDAPAPTLR
jgi:iron(III) transport system ATP-binding protein